MKIQLCSVTPVGEKGQQAEAESEWRKPATYTSLIALIVSLSVAGYTLWKDSRARRHSVEDDYWLRKIVGPVAVEPLLKDILEMIATTPADNTEPAFDGTSIQAFHTTYVKKLAHLAEHSFSLQLVEHTLADRVSVLLDEIQDLLIDYCSAQGNTSLPQITRSLFQREVRDKLMAMLRQIKSFQVKLK